MSRLARLSLVTTILTFLLATAGGLVRATDSGLGCPGWPTCYGRWIPPANHHAIIEWTHRLLASLVSFGVIATCVVAVLFYRRDRRTVTLGLAIVPLVIGQALLGAYVVKHKLEAWTVVAHLGLGMGFAATLIFLTVHLTTTSRGRAAPRTVGLLTAAAGGVFLQLLLGSWVTGQEAGLAFKDWPLYGGKVVPNLGHESAALQFAHRTWAYVLVALVITVAVHVRRRYAPGDPVRRLATAAAGLILVQVGLGVLNIATRLNAAVVTAHLGVATLIWGSLVSALAVALRRDPSELTVKSRPRGRDFTVSSAGQEAEVASGRSVGEKVSAYVALTKPRIIELLLVTTVPTMVVAKRGLPSLWLVLATLVGGSLAAGGANAINMYVDRDIDKLMKRTAKRPLVTGAVEPRNALVFALTLEVLAFVELWSLVNLLSAVLAVSATLFYVFVYTLWLKRRSTSNIVIGGAAGAVPVLVGWSAVTGSLGVAPLVLFAIIFVWTPPHFWALAIKYREDYAAADVPMLPAVASFTKTARQIVVYTVALWVASLAFADVGRMGLIYVVAAVVLGGVFLAGALQLARQRTPDASNRWAMRLFSYSISYVTLLFGSMALDQLVKVGR
ncbi:MAG: protoheme IX farnesyltransferase [Actinobacteria bacterium]|nr:protoheme IX farnesyltransferase [Actinomycetota bacterium]